MKRLLLGILLMSLGFAHAAPGDKFAYSLLEDTQTHTAQDTFEQGIKFGDGTVVRSTDAFNTGGGGGGGGWTDSGLFVNVTIPSAYILLQSTAGVDPDPSHYKIEMEVSNSSVVDNDVHRWIRLQGSRLNDFWTFLTTEASGDDKASHTMTMRGASNGSANIINMANENAAEGSKNTFLFTRPAVGTNAQVDVYSGGSREGDVDFLTSPSGTGSLAQTITFTGDNKVGIATTNPAQKLDVVGTIQATGLKLPLASVGNLKILKSDASGNVAWVDNAWKGHCIFNGTTVGTGIPCLNSTEGSGKIASINRISTGLYDVIFELSAFADANYVAVCTASSDLSTYNCQVRYSEQNNLKTRLEIRDHGNSVQDSTRVNVIVFGN